MKKDGITFFYPGHYDGKNVETQQRVNDLITLSKDVLSGKVKGEKNTGNGFGLPLLLAITVFALTLAKNHLIRKQGFKLASYSDNINLLAVR